MKSSKYELNMTQGSILKNLIRFAVPMLLANVLQHLYNAADIIVVSRWSGSTAMASVGSTSALTNLLVNFFVGMAIGTTVIVSRRFGADDKKALDKAVHTSVMFGIILGLLVCLIGETLCRPLLCLLDTPGGEVLDGAVLYMRIIFAGTPATVLYNYGAACLRSLGDTKRPLYIVAFTGLLNFLLNILFVIKFNMGVAGVALATVISKYINIIIVLYLLRNKIGACEFRFRKLRIFKDEFVQILKIGVPAGLQNIFMSLANTIIQSQVNTFGAAAIAGNAAAANIENFTLSIKVSFRQATVTAVSQNYGAKNEERMNKSVKTALLCMISGCLLLGAIMVLFAKPLLGIYITDSPEAIYFGTIRLVVTALPYCLSGVMEILTGYLRGLGYSSLTTVNSFIGLCGFRILYVLFVFPLNRTFWMLYLGTPITWMVVSILNIITLKIVKKDAIIKMYEA